MMGTPVRILQVLGGLERGGAETVVMNLYRNIDRENIQFDFVIHTEEKGSYYDEVVSLGGVVYHCPKYVLSNHFNYKKWWKQFFENHPEYKVMHSHVRSCASVYIPIAKKNGLKTIIHSHSTSNGSGIKSIVKKIMQYPLRYQADFFFGCSKAAGEWLFGDKVVNSKRYYTVKNAIDVDLYSSNNYIRKEYRDSFGIGPKTTVYVHVGRFHQAKNHMFLLETFAEIHSKQADSVLLLVGDGELRNKIVEKISNLKINDSVRLLGSREDVPNILQAADCFVFPSVWEGLPTSVIESQAAGLPCFVSNAVTSEVSVTKLCTFLMVDTPQQWADRILKSDLKRQNCLLDIRKSGYDINNVALQLQNFYLDQINI